MSTSTLGRFPGIEQMQEAGLRLVYAKKTRCHQWSLKDGDELISFLAIYRISRHHPWEIGYVETHPKWRRMGLAAALYAHASSKLGEVHHDVTRTDEGNCWARAVGGPLPPWTRIP